MKQLKNALKTLIQKSGFDIVRIRRNYMGMDPISDMQHFLRGCEEPLILDVGANVGQSVDRFKRAFPNSSIHSFEPSPSTYEKLKQRCCQYQEVKAWNYGVGTTNTTLEFQENSFSDMSSFLTPDKKSWGEVVKVTNVKVVTLDSFAEDHNLDFIHILKSDTQGYDFEVLKGARQLMNENRIGLIYFEVIFSEMYKNLPQVHEILKYLHENNYSLVTFYEQFYQEELLSWTDALFINQEYYQKTIEQWRKTGVRVNALGGALDRT
jgi:FkbM family methyltransferase